MPDGAIDVSWGYDAVADLRAALDLFIERASQIDLVAHPGGVRPEPTTLAALALVGIALEHDESISAAPLARLAQDTFGYALDLAPKPKKTKPKKKRTSKLAGGTQVVREASGAPGDEAVQPDWHDRISEALAEHRCAPPTRPRKIV